MDLIKINDNKLKIMLTPGDMKGYSLDVDTMDYTQSETRRAFRNILNEVKNRTGFDASGDKIYVQLYPSREGGCEMFVTKLGLLCSMNDNAERPSLSSSGKASLSSRPKKYASPAPAYPHSVAFAFDVLDALLHACYRLHARAYPGQSAAFHGEEGKYYLILSEDSLTNNTATSNTADHRSLSWDDDILALLGEYGTQENVQTVRLYIQEHGSTICASHAVECLSSL